MPMICPHCNGTFEQRLNCPTCNVRLLYQAPTGRGGFGHGEESWQETPWGRVLIGLLLAQGLYYGLRQLCTAGLLAADSRGDAWKTLSGLIVLQALQGLGVLTAGILTGAGKRRGFAFGAMLGMWNGVLFLIADIVQGHPGLLERWIGPDLRGDPTAATMLFPPILQGVIGALGGLIGSSIWKPLPDLTVSAPLMPERVLVPMPAPSRPWFTGPIAWARVLFGSALGAAGVLTANMLLDWVLDASEGKLALTSHMQTRLVTWEICALAILVASGLAGATTNNGFKQGLCVGLGVGFLVLMISIASGRVPPDLLLFTLLSAVPLGLLGGAFGSQLLPPLYTAPRRKHADSDYV